MQPVRKTLVRLTLQTGMGLDIVDPARLGAVNVRQNLSSKPTVGIYLKQLTHC